VTNGLSGGAGLTFTDTDSNGISGDSPADNAVNASDAAILINNIAATSSSNTFVDVVEGVTLTVFKVDPAVTVGVDVVPDGEALRTKVDAFVKAYNALVEFQDAQRAKSGAPDAIANVPILRQVRATLRSALQGSHGTGEFTRLAEVGIEFTRTGTLTVNKAAFDGALASNGNALRELFGGADGVFTQAVSQLADFTRVDGMIPMATERLTDQVQSMSTRIAALEARLAVQREGLLRQFIEADLAMSRLNNQSGSLAQIGSGFGSL
jgi:flagellar hook-associated protein 2